MTSNRDIPFAKSIVDYVFRWLGMTFLEEFRKANMPARPEVKGDSPAPRTLVKAVPEAVKDDASSEPGRVDQASSTDGKRPIGAFIPDSRGGNGDGIRAAAATEVKGRLAARVERVDQQFSHYQEDAPACDVCGSITVRNGNCYKCYNCGSSLGCS